MKTILDMLLAWMTQYTQLYHIQVLSDENLSNISKIWYCPLFVLLTFIKRLINKHGWNAVVKSVLLSKFTTNYMFWPNSCCQIVCVNTQVLAFPSLSQKYVRNAGVEAVIQSSALVPTGCLIMKDINYELIAPTK